MNSCLYECEIKHDRHMPRRYCFTNKMFMFYLDLDELPRLGSVSWLLGYHQSRVYEFRESDHVLGIREYLSRQGMGERVKKIRLLTNLRTFGYIFNPVSFYFCFDADDQPLCAVSEIGNTFGELKLFFLGEDKRKLQTFHDRQTKYYYISPFMDLDHILDFHLQVPSEDLAIAVNVVKEEKPFFYASIRGQRKILNTANLLGETIKFPFVTLYVIFWIHWHAAVLHFIKKIPHHAKEANPQLQQEVYREWVKK